MRLPLLISLSLLLLSWQNAGAQVAPADDFFNSGAQFYISNNIPQAKDITEMGLKLYPDDDKLKKLDQLLNQKQQQQNQQQQQQNQQQQNQQSQSDSQNNQQQQQDKQQQNQSEQQKKEQQKQAEQNQQEQNASGAKPDNPDQNTNGEAMRATQMTPEEAKRLLDAQRENEKILPISPQGKPHNPLQTVKDW
jgi:Ca-activated chloride channel family protein